MNLPELVECQSMRFKPRFSKYLNSNATKNLTYIGGSNLTLIMLFSLSMKNVACGISNFA